MECFFWFIPFARDVHLGRSTVFYYLRLKLCSYSFFLLELILHKYFRGRVVEEETKSPPTVQEPPPEWVSEIHRVRSEVARFKASANRSVRASVEAAMSVRAKAEKRRAEVMDNIPAHE